MVNVKSSLLEEQTAISTCSYKSKEWLTANVKGISSQLLLFNASQPDVSEDFLAVIVFYAFGLNPGTLHVCKSEILSCTTR